MPTEDTGAQTKLYEPVVLAGNGSALDSAKIKQKYYQPEKNLYLTYIPNCYLRSKCTTTQMGYLK